MLVGVVWAFGLAGYLGIPLSVVTISGLPILLGIGIDFAVQMHSRVEEEVQLDRAPHPIQETTTNLVPPLIIATLRLRRSPALLLAEVPMIRTFGVLLAIGILVVLVADIVLPTAVLGAREYYRPTPSRDYTTDAVGRAVVKLGSLPKSAVPVLAVASLAVFVGGAIVDPMLDLQTDPEEWVDQDSQVIADIDFLKQEVESSSELGMFIETEEPFSDEAVAWVHEFANEALAEHDLLLTASSIVTTVSFLLEIPDTTLLAPTGQDVANAYAVAPEGIQTSVAREEGRALNLIFRTGAGPLEDRAVVVNDIRDSIEPPAGVSATPSGLAVVGVGLLENLESNRTLLTYVALGAVFVFLLLRLRSPIRALLSHDPGAHGRRRRLARRLRRRLQAQPADRARRAARDRGVHRVHVAHPHPAHGGATPGPGPPGGGGPGLGPDRSGVRHVGADHDRWCRRPGCLPLPLLRDFGLITSINVAVALLSALVVLPPIMVWADRRGWVHDERWGPGADDEVPAHLGVDPSAPHGIRPGT